MSFIVHISVYMLFVCILYNLLYIEETFKLNIIAKEGMYNNLVSLFRKKELTFVNGEIDTTGVGIIQVSNVLINSETNLCYYNLSVKT